MPMQRIYFKTCRKNILKTSTTQRCDKNIKKRKNLFMSMMFTKQYRMCEKHFILLAKKTFHRCVFMFHAEVCLCDAKWYKAHDTRSRYRRHKFDARFRRHFSVDAWLLTSVTYFWRQTDAVIWRRILTYGADFWSVCQAPKYVLCILEVIIYRVAHNKRSELWR